LAINMPLRCQGEAGFGMPQNLAASHREEDSVQAWLHTRRKSRSHRGVSASTNPGCEVHEPNLMACKEADKYCCTQSLQAGNRQFPQARKSSIPVSPQARKPISPQARKTLKQPLKQWDMAEECQAPDNTRGARRRSFVSLLRVEMSLECANRLTHEVGAVQMVLWHGQTGDRDGTEGGQIPDKQNTKVCGDSVCEAQLCGNCGSCRRN